MTDPMANPMTEWEQPDRPRRRRRWWLLGAAAAAVVAVVAWTAFGDDAGDDGSLRIESADDDPDGDDGRDGAGAPSALEPPPRRVAGGDWQPVAPAPVDPRFNALHAWTGDELIIAGGDDGAGGSPRAAAYDPADDAWRELSDAPAPLRRPGQRGVWTGDELVVWGGADEPVGAAFDPDADAWRDLADAPLSPRRHHLMVAAGDAVLVWGGRGDDGAALGDGAAYDPDADAWRPLPDAPSVAGLGVGVWTGDELLVFAPPTDDAGDVRAEATTDDGPVDGERDGNWAGAAYDPDADTWRQLAALPRRAGAGVPSLTWADGEALLCCEFAGGAHLAAYDPAADAWASRGAAPVGRRTLHAHAWSGEHLVVWGGRVRDRWIRSSGGTYDPAADEWASLPDTPGDPARIQPVGAWIDEGFLVWGGYDGRAAQAGGWIWRP